MVGTVCILGTVALTLVAMFVAGPAMAKSSVNGSKLVFHRLNITSINGNVVSTIATGQIEHAGPFDATVGGPHFWNL